MPCQDTTTQTFQQTNQPRNKQTKQKKTNKSNKQTKHCHKKVKKTNQAKNSKNTSHLKFDPPIEIPLCSPTNSPVKVDRPAQGIPAMWSWLSVRLWDFISLLHMVKEQRQGGKKRGSTRIPFCTHQDTTRPGDFVLEGIIQDYIIQMVVFLSETLVLRPPVWVWNIFYTQQRRSRLPQQSG